MIAAARLASRLLRAALPALLLVVAPAPPAFALDGQVILAGSAQPVSGAEVNVLGRTGAARTDAEGRFRLWPDPPLPFELLVVLPGERYMKPQLIQALPAQGPLVVTVEPLLMESVTVTAGAAPDIVAAPASANTLLSRTDIEVREPTNLMQALENVAGVNKVSEGQAAVPAVRGLARGRTLILIDDARVSSERRVGASATFLDPFALEGIQVSRGPGSVAYGSDAFGGVIHARTRRPEPGSGWTARAVGTLGSGEPQERANLELGRGWEQGGLLAQAHYRDFDDYHSPEGEVLNSGSTDAGFLLRGAQRLGGGNLSAGWQSDFGTDIERPRTNSSSTRFYYPNEDSHRLTAAYDMSEGLGLERLTLSAFLGGYQQTTDQDRVATESSPRAIERAVVDARDFHLRATGEKAVGAARIGFGVDVNGRFDLETEEVRIDFDLEGNEIARATLTTIEDAARTDTGLFASVEVAASPWLALEGGARFDHVASSNRGGYFGDRSTTNSAFSGYAAATVGSFRGFSLSAQIARGFRDPVLSDRYFRGVTGRGFITGNPDLEPETSAQIDGALRYTGRGFRAAFYAYEYRLRELIERYEDGEDLFFFRNRAEARLRGLELEAQAELPQALTLDLSFQHQRGKTLDDEAPLDDLSPTTLTLQVRRGLGTRAFVQLRGALYAEDSEAGPTEIATPGHSIVDLSAGYKLDRRLELRLLGRNLFDQTYPVSPDSRAVLAPGISGVLTLICRL